MKKKFLTVYDYGMGGVWTYILANSAKDVSDKYPKLKVLDQEPDWFFDQDTNKIIRTVDIDDLPDPFLREVRKPLPTVHLELRVSTDEMDELERLITEFGNVHGFSIEEERTQATTVHGHPREMFMMFLVRSDMDLYVENYRESNRMKIEICNVHQSLDFDAMAAEFRELLESRWPDQMRLCRGEG